MPPETKNPDTITHNIESIAAFYQREHEKVTAPQRLVERISVFAAQPSFLGATILFVVLWILANIGAQHLQWPHFDHYPYHVLHLIITVLALLAATMVLVRQERQAKIDELRDHLELQLNLLTEQKTTKLINLIEELRRDLPMVRNRHDVESEAMQQTTDPLRVLAEIDAIGVPVTAQRITATESKAEEK